MGSEGAGTIEQPANLPFGLADMSSLPKGTSTYIHAGLKTAKSVPHFPVTSRGVKLHIPHGFFCMSGNGFLGSNKSLGPGLLMMECLVLVPRLGITKIAEI